jgi:hypothetical protein
MKKMRELSIDLPGPGDLLWYHATPVLVLERARVVDAGVHADRAGARTLVTEAHVRVPVLMHARVRVINVLVDEWHDIVRPA